MAIIDVVTFNGEYDLFELRYQMLKDYVDEFILVEARTTFSGQPKPLYSLAEEVFYDPIPTWPKVKVWEIDENWTEQEKQLAFDSPNTLGAAHWTREFLQKESIKKALAHLNDTDIVFVGDTDEIWSPKALEIKALPLKLKLDVYTYYLNNRSSEQFWGTLVAPYYLIQGACLNHLRTRAPKSKKSLGWHFTSLAHSLEKKLTDSYTHESYATPEVLENVAYNIENNRDFLGRDFAYKTDESQWPQYLKDHRANYTNLLAIEKSNEPGASRTSNAPEN